MSSNIYSDAASSWRTFRSFLILILFYLGNINAFNVDLSTAIYHHGSNNSMFGFSVAEYKEDGRSWVLIGAPESPDPASFGGSDYRGGSVYFCSTNRNNDCRTMPFPRTAIDYQRKEYRGRQWLGATVTTSGPNGSIVACYPRFYWFGPSGNSSLNREPVGGCFYSEKGFNFTEYSPCRIKNKASIGYAKLGSCQAGFSAALSKKGDRIYVGAPGSYYWQGQLFSIHKILKLPYAYNDIEVVFDDTGSVQSRRILNTPEIRATTDMGQQADDSYMGYSVAALDFYNAGAGVVAGIPRADRLLGQVRIFDWNITEFLNITGTQFASYFGYAVAISDVDGDGSDDIIVGAPMYSDFKSQKNDYESGRVYVYYQGNKPCTSLNSPCMKEKFTRHSFIDGEYSKARFGLSIASLGDINQDGFGDFAVGAPYQGSFDDCREPKFSGAVYIYHGGKKGVRRKYSQVITAENVYHQVGSVSPSLTTFGFSLSGGIDLDDNLYPDLAVGAYESDVVYLFRSRPVIQLGVDFSFLSRKKIIGLDERTCNLKNSKQWVPCVVLQLCLQYNGIGVEEQIELALDITLDSKINKNPRMFFLDQEGGHLLHERVPLYKGSTLCKNMTTYIVPLTPYQDKLSPFEVELKYSLVEAPIRKSNVLQSILNMDDETPLTRRDSLAIKNNCGEDNICIPDLRMNIKSNAENYTLGSGHLLFNVSVVNEGEDAFGSYFKLKLPPDGIHYSKFEVIKSAYDVTVQCYAPSLYNNYSVICDIGNPLPSGKMVNFSIILEPNPEVEEPRFEFWANVNSANAELNNTMENNEKSISILIVENTTLHIEGISSPSEIFYNISQYEFEKIESDTQAGPFLKHEYIIKNLGPSEVSEAIAVFYWPLKLRTGEDLLYLLSKPETKGPIECERVPIINYRNLALKRKIKDYESGGTKESWQHTGQSGSHTSGSSFTHVTSQTTVTGQSGKPSQSSINEIHSTSNIDKFSTGNKGYGYSKNDGTFQVGVIDLNQQNIGTGVSQQSGQREVYQGGQGGYSQSGHEYTISQSGYSGVAQRGQSGYSGVAQSGQSGYSGVAQSGQSEYSGVTQSGQSGYSGIAQSGQSGYSGVAQKGQGGYSEVAQGEHSRQQTQIGHTAYTGGSQGYYGSFQGGASVNTQPQPGTFQSGVSQENIQTGGGYQQIGQSYGVSGDRKNFHTFHESETSYVNSSNWDGNTPNTYIEAKWRTNDNGLVRNGSYSNVHPGFGYENINLNTDKKNFFSNQNEATYIQNRGYGSGIDVNAVGNGFVKSEYDSNTGTRITTIDEGVQKYNPDIKRRFNETGNVYRYKSENTQIVDSDSNGHVSFTPTFTVNKNANIQKSRTQLPLHSDDKDEYENDDEVEDDDEDETDDTEDRGHHPRKTRQVDNGFPDNSFCSSAECLQVQCYIRRLSRDQEVSVTFPAVVWVKTFEKIALFRPVQVGSYVEVNVTKLPHIRAQLSTVNYAAEILTNITSLDYGKTAPDVIPLWVVVGSACLGALILMLLVYLLYKSGFFKRNRPPVIPERQPLNRNGQYHAGDEAL